MRDFDGPRLAKPLTGLGPISEGRERQATVKGVLGARRVAPTAALTLERCERLLGFGVSTLLEIGLRFGERRGAREQQQEQEEQRSEEFPAHGPPAFSIPNRLRRDTGCRSFFY